MLRAVPLFLSLLLTGSLLLSCEPPLRTGASPPVPQWSFSPPHHGAYETRVGVAASAGQGYDVYRSLGGNPTTSGTLQDGPVWLGERKTWSLNWSTPVGSGWDKVRSTTYRLDPSRPQAAVGADHSLVVNSTTLYAWGNDDNGQLGQGSLHFGGIAAPALVPHEESILGAWAAGDSSMFLDEEGALWVFGRGPWLFDASGYVVILPVPRRVPLAAELRVKTAALGAFGSVWAVDTLGQLWVWGINAGGSFGAGTPGDEVRTPVKVLDSVALVVSGLYHTLVLKTDGSLWVAGLHEDIAVGSGNAEGGNRYNRLGTGASTDDALVWTLIGTWPDVFSLGAASDHSWLLTQAGDLWVWGANTFGQLPGVAETERVDVPTKVMTKVVAAAASTRYTLVLRETGALADYGESIKPFPALTAADGVRSLQVSAFHALALTGGFHDYSPDPWASLRFWGAHSL